MVGELDALPVATLEHRVRAWHMFSFLVIAIVLVFAAVQAIFISVADPSCAQNQRKQASDKRKHVGRFLNECNQKLTNWNASAGSRAFECVAAAFFVLTMRSLVADIVAIWISVALPRLWNAQDSVRASEVVRLARNQRAIGGETVDLIAAIAAVCFAVAAPRRVDALPAGAYELLRSARRIRAIGLVAFVETIDFTVAAPRVHVARRCVCALDEQARHARALVYRAADFVGRVWTILILVTPIIMIDALARRTLEVLAGAVANRFVATIAAVLNAIASQRHLHTSTIIALEVARRADASVAIGETFVGCIATMVDRVARQMERNAFAGFAQKLTFDRAHCVARTGHTPAPVVRQTTHRAFALRLSVHQRADVFAATIEHRARIRRAVLRCILYGNDAHQAADVLSQPHHVGARVFIRSQHSAQHPIGPIQVILVNGHGERMFGRRMRQHHTVRPIVVDALNFIETRVRPVQFVILVVQRYCVRHANVGGDDALQSVAGDVGALNRRRFQIPISPVHHSQTRLDCDAARLVVRIQLDHLRHVLVVCLDIVLSQFSHFERTNRCLRIRCGRPKQFIANGIVGDAFDRHLLVDNGLVIAAVEINPIDRAGMHVRIEDSASRIVVAESDRVSQKCRILNLCNRSIHVQMIGDVNALNGGNARID